MGPPLAGECTVDLAIVINAAVHAMGAIVPLQHVPDPMYDSCITKGRRARDDAFSVQAALAQQVAAHTQLPSPPGLWACTMAAAQAPCGLVDHSMWLQVVFGGHEHLAVVPVVARDTKVIQGSTGALADLSVEADHIEPRSKAGITRLSVDSDPASSPVRLASQTAQTPPIRHGAEDTVSQSDQRQAARLVFGALLAAACGAMLACLTRLSLHSLGISDARWHQSRSGCAVVERKPHACTPTRQAECASCSNLAAHLWTFAPDCEHSGSPNSGHLLHDDQRGLSWLSKPGSPDCTPAESLQSSMSLAFGVSAQPTACAGAPEGCAQPQVMQQMHRQAPTLTPAKAWMRGVPRCRPVVHALQPDATMRLCDVCKQDIAMPASAVELTPPLVAGAVNLPGSHNTGQTSGAALSHQGLQACVDNVLSEWRAAGSAVTMVDNTNQTWHDTHAGDGDHPGGNGTQAAEHPTGSHAKHCNVAQGSQQAPARRQVGSAASHQQMALATTASFPDHTKSGQQLVRTSRGHSGGMKCRHAYQRMSSSKSSPVKIGQSRASGRYDGFAAMLSNDVADWQLAQQWHSGNPDAVCPTDLTHWSPPMIPEVSELEAVVSASPAGSASSSGGSHQASASAARQQVPLLAQGGSKPAPESHQAQAPPDACSSHSAMQHGLCGACEECQPGAMHGSSEASRGSGRYCPWLLQARQRGSHSYPSSLANLAAGAVHVHTEPVNMIRLYEVRPGVLDNLSAGSNTSRDVGSGEAHESSGGASLPHMDTQAYTYP